MNLQKKNIQNLEPYVCARDIFTKGIFLDANEAPGQWVDIDWSRVKDLNRYPDSRANELRDKLAEFLSIPNFEIERENLFIGNGSDEIIDLLIKVFVEADECIMTMNPSYSVYDVQANTYGVGIKNIDLQEDFSIDTDEILANTEDVKIIFLCSPNNPTGNLLREENLLRILESFEGLVVVDEAYIEFAGEDASYLKLIKKYENLVILRTFSKAWGLAGIRVGYSVARVEITQVLLKSKESYNTTAVSQELALQALEQSSALEKVIAQTLQIKSNLEQELTEMGLEVIPSSANFTLVRIPDATRIYEQCAKQGVIIRNRSKLYLLDNVLRISIGSKTEIEQLLKILGEIV